ncbi:MAG: PEP-CTERM system TPR-repeat protein PrsT [Gammaproteobacteria bacterium]|nr:PEP-CTERM system TPR-repeat protein PrsT [Gammaproteobacteria bacterium]
MSLSKKLSILCIFIGLNTAVYSSSFASTASPERVQDAEKAIEKRDYPTAIIHLKNQLKETPKNAHARFLLGGIYLNTGKIDSSLKELGRAHQLQPENTLFLFQYAQALQASGKYNKLLTLLKNPLDDKNKESQRLNLAAYAHLGLKELKKARNKFEKSNTLQKNANAYNGLANLSLFEKNYTAAEQFVSQSLSINPDNPSTLQLKAKLANINQESEQALKIYNKLIEKAPDNLTYRLERAATYAIKKQSKEAKADLKIILDRYDNHPQANFIKAQLLLQEKDFSGAQEASQKVVNIAPKHMPAAFILSAANFALKNYNQAEEYLTIYLGSNPANLKAQNLLANVYLSQGKAKQSLLILEGIPEKQREKDPLLLVTLGGAYIQDGQTEKGLVQLNKAQALAPNNQEIKKRLIAAQFQIGELDDAIAELEELADIQDNAKEKTSQIQTNYLLIISYIKQKQLDKADEKINKMLAKTPNDLKILNLKALTLQLQGDATKAMAQYNSIIKQDNKNVPAYMGMARVSALESNWQEAEKNFKKVIKINPDALKAYLGLAAIAEKQNKPKATEQYFLDALEQSKNSIPSQLAVAGLLSQWYQSKQQPEKILALANKLDKQHQNNNKIRSFLAQAQILNKQQDRAERTLKSIITYDKKDIKHRVLLAKIISNDKKRVNESLDLLNESILITPENQGLYTLKADLLVSNKNYDKAVEQAKILQETFPDSTIGHLLEADIYRAQKKHEQALSIYQKMYKITPDNTKVFSAIIDMLLSLNQKDEAISLLSKSVKNESATPEDFNNLFKLASLHHEKQELTKAETYYLRILEKNPAHVATLNNLAWIKIDTDIKKAVQLAKQAHDSAPKSAAIMDTYGYFLVKDNQYKAGFDLLKKSAQELPDDKDIQFHLAFAYSKLGQSKNALKILEKIIHSKQPFSEQKKALALYQELK